MYSEFGFVKQTINSTDLYQLNVNLGILVKKIAWMDNEAMNTLELGWA